MRISEKAILTLLAYIGLFAIVWTFERLPFHVVDVKCQHTCHAQDFNYHRYTKMSDWIDSPTDDDNNIVMMTTYVMTFPGRRHNWTRRWPACRDVVSALFGDRTTPPQCVVTSFIDVLQCPLGEVTTSTTPSWPGNIFQLNSMSTVEFQKYSLTIQTDAFDRITMIIIYRYIYSI